MHGQNLNQWQHDHTFAQDERRPGESRTLTVIAITAVMMVVEIVAGRQARAVAKPVERAGQRIQRRLNASGV